MRTIEQHAQALADGRTTSRALVEHCLARIADPSGEGARAFIKVHAGAAHAQWRMRWTAAPRRREPSRYAGIPVSLKDLFDIAGEATPAGSRVLADAPPAAAHAPAVQRMLAAGFVPVGPHQHDRVRLLRSRHQPALRHAALAMGPRGRPHSRRQFVGHRGVGLRRHGGRWSRHRYRRLLPHSGGVLRHRRLQADRAARAGHRRAAAGAEPRFGGTACAERRVLRGDRRRAGRRDTNAAGARQPERTAPRGADQRRARRHGRDREQRVRPRARPAVARPAPASRACTFPSSTRSRSQCQGRLRRLRGLCLAPRAARREGRRLRSAHSHAHRTRRAA